jgi:hypothetical protein
VRTLQELGYFERSVDTEELRKLRNLSTVEPGVTEYWGWVVRKQADRMKIGFVTRCDKTATWILRSREQIFTPRFAVVFYYAHSLMKSGRERGWKRETEIPVV